MNALLELFDPPIAHDLIHVGLFFASVITSLAIGGVVYLLALFAPGMRL